MKRLYLATAFLLLGPAAHAGTLAVYDFTGLDGKTNAPVTSHVPGATFGDIERGGGIAPNAGADSINSKGWTAGDGYYTFTVTPTAGSSLDLSALEYTDRRSTTGPTTFNVRYSFGDFASSDSIETYFLKSKDTSNHREFVDLSGIAPLADLSAQVTFFIVGSGASSDAGTYRLGVNGTPSGPNPANLEILSPTAAVPEPPGAILLVLGLAGVVVLGRGRVA